MVMFDPAKVGSDMPSVSPEENHTPGTTWYVKISVKNSNLYSVNTEVLSKYIDIELCFKMFRWVRVKPTFEIWVISCNAWQIGQNLSKGRVLWGKNGKCSSWKKMPNAEIATEKIHRYNKLLSFSFSYTLMHFRVLLELGQRISRRIGSRGFRGTRKWTRQKVSAPSRPNGWRRSEPLCLLTLSWLLG